MFNVSELKRINKGMHLKIQNGRDSLGLSNDPDYVEKVTHDIAEDEGLSLKIEGFISDAEIIENHGK